MALRKGSIRSLREIYVEVRFVLGDGEIDLIAQSPIVKEQSVRAAAGTQDKLPDVESIRIERAPSLKSNNYHQLVGSSVVGRDELKVSGR